MYVLSDGDNLPLQTINLGSISGVVAATMLAVEVLKRALKRVTFFEKVPVFVYAIILAIGFGTLANRVIRMSDGTYLLAGEYWKVIWACAIAAAGASGFYTWIRNPETVKTASTITGMVIMSGLAISSMGCGSGNTPQHITLRESMDQSNKTFQAEDIDWATKLMVNADGKDQRDQLPRLTPKDLQRRIDTKAEYDRLVNEDRARDAQGSPLDFLFGKKPTTQP
jgi:hypothetical protein